jgi:hypothetical protein
MTAENFLQESIEISHFFNDEYEKMCCLSEEVQKAMVGFATLKCKELLEIVAEKAKTKKKYFSHELGGSYQKVGNVSKKSILNVVDLKEFIK